jgi:hypothetical protein
VRRSQRTLSNLAKIIGIALVAAAIFQEMGKPRQEREWHGRIAGLVPYDFRFPTVARFRERLWNPDDDRIFTERVFGVGWTINFHTLLRKSRSAGEEPSPTETEDE